MPSALQVGQTLPPEMGKLSLFDQTEHEITFDSILGQASTLIIMLRHFGCIACSEHVKQWIPHLDALAQNQVRTCFIGNGLPRYMAGFKERHQLADKPLTLYTDPDLAIYDAAGMVRSISSNLRFSSIKNGIRAFARGNRQVSIEGNPNQQGGILIFDAGKNLVFKHCEKGLGDHLSVKTVCTKLKVT